MVRIVSLHVYPVKSCRGIDLDTARVTRTGIAHDREWMITSPAGRFLTQREEPRLALIETQLTPEALVLTAPGCAALPVPYAHDGTPTEVVIWKDRCAAVRPGRCGSGLADASARQAAATRALRSARRAAERLRRGRGDGLRTVLGWLRDPRDLDRIARRPELAFAATAADEPLSAQRRRGRPAGLR